MSAAPNVGLLFGGRSVEHEVSVISARAVSRALEQAGLACRPIGVTKQGRWLARARSAEILRGSQTQVRPGDPDDGLRLTLVPGAPGALHELHPDGSSRALALDVVFPLMHGWGGEDGRLQGALELAGLPYVGAGVLGSAAGMDKVLSRELFQACGLPVARWLSFHRCEYRAGRAATHERIGRELDYPLFVKPSNGGSSVGISRVKTADELGPACELALEHDERVVVEQGLDAREIECAVMGNDTPQATGLGEIVPAREFYDYEAKYVDDSSRLLIPADLPADVTERVRFYALAAFRALQLRGYARVDFLLDRRTLKIFLNEVNTLPGFTPISMFPKLWQAAGLEFPDLVRRLVDLAVERAVA